MIREMGKSRRERKPNENWEKYRFRIREVGVVKAKRLCAGQRVVWIAKLWGTPALSMSEDRHKRQRDRSVQNLGGTKEKILWWPVLFHHRAQREYELQDSSVLQLARHVKCNGDVNIYKTSIRIDPLQGRHRRKIWSALSVQYSLYARIYSFWTACVCSILFNWHVWTKTCLKLKFLKRIKASALQKQQKD